MMPQLNTFRDLLPKIHHSSLEVSTWGVGQHLNHCCVAGIGIFEALKSSERGLEKPAFHPLRTLVLTTGFIPRGKGKAPESVLPPDTISEGELLAQIKETEEAMESILELPKDHWWQHPVFGILNPRQSRRFIEVHNSHHLKIIKDILKSTR